MKKIVVALVVLALAGGGAFAQGWTFSGLVDVGLSMTIADDWDDPRIDNLSSDMTNAAARTQLRSVFVSEDRTRGVDFLLRHDGWVGGAGATSFAHAFGWVSLFDGLLTAYGGRVDVGYFNALDLMSAGINSGFGPGLLFVVDPMDNLRLGFGGYATGGQWFNTYSHDAADNPHALGVFSMSFAQPDTFRLRFSLRNASQVAAAGGSNSAQAYVSFAFDALDDMTIAVTGHFLQLEDFGDAGEMRFHFTALHTGLMDGLNLTLGATVGLSNDDAHDDMHLWFWAWVDYAVNDVVVPRLHIHYVMGGTMGANPVAGSGNNFHVASFRDNATFNSDHSLFQLRPSVQLRVAPASFLEVGGLIHMNLGDLPTWHSADNMDMALYALVRVAF